MNSNPRNKKPAGRAGSLHIGYGTSISHLIKAVQWMVTARGLRPRVFGDPAAAFRLATELRREGHDAEVRPITPPVQLELQF